MVAKLQIQYSPSMAFVLQEKENGVPFETLIRLHCPSPNCEKFYITKKSLNEHFRLYLTHKPESLKNSHTQVSTKEISETFLRGEQPYSIKMYAGIERKFNQLLRERVQKSIN